MTPISVALWKPKFFNGASIIEVAPTHYMLSNACKMNEYLILYSSMLSGLNAFKILERINELSEGKDVALCCYEKPGDFCHRHLLAGWLTKETGVEIIEYGVAEKPKTQTQTELQF
ncbi:MAG: DUF488 family protein [Paludibacteraceae bacterium]|nr:DUF488 family protein [Paludibacteraceae bacterium]